MECKHKKEHMLCNGAEYCMGNTYIGNDIANLKTKSKAFSDMAKGIKNGIFESYYTYNELLEKSKQYSEQANFLKENDTIIKVFCMGDFL